MLGEPLAASTEPDPRAKTRRIVTLERKNPPFAETAKDGAPSIIRQGPTLDPSEQDFNRLTLNLNSPAKRPADEKGAHPLRTKRAAPTRKTKSAPSRLRWQPSGVEE